MTRDWSDDWIVRELARILRDIPAIDPRLARRLLLELPPEQRALMVEALAQLDDDRPGPRGAPS